MSTEHHILKAILSCSILFVKPSGNVLTWVNFLSWDSVVGSGTQDGAKRGWSSARDSGSDVTTTAYKGRGALSTEAVVPKPQSDHRRHIATDGRRRQVLVRLEMLHHYHSDHPDSHTPARYPPLGLIQIRPNACTVILKLILFQNIVEPTRIWNKA